MKVHLFRLLLFVCLLAAVMLLPALFRRWRRPGKISPQQLQTLLSQGESPLVLDVRNPDELVGERGHMKEAVLIPLSELDTKIGELKDYRTHPIVTV